MNSFSERLSAVPDGGGKSSEYELAEQDAQRRAPAARRPSEGLERPDRRPPPQNPPLDEDDVQRGRDKLDRVIAK